MKMSNCLCLAVILTASAVNAVTFEQARPVWPESSDGLPNENVRFAASFETDGRPLVLKATGATQYKIRLDGETIGWGPARAPEGWARVSEIPLEVVKGRHELVFEMSGYNVRSLYCNIPQPAYLQAELVDADGKVLAATGTNGAFKVTPIAARHRKTVRFSSQRGFVECWTLPEKKEKCLTLAERPAKRLTIRRAPEPNLSVNWPLKAVGEVSVRHDPDADAKQWEYVVETSANPSNGYSIAEQVWDACRKSQQFVALEEMRPVSDENMLLLKAGTRLRFDGGIEKTGFVRMKVKVAKPGKLWLNWSELLVWGKVNSFKMRNADISAWEFSEPGEYEIETAEPYTLRYLEVTAESGEFELSKVLVRLLESPEAAAAKLPRTGDAELDEVFAAARNTLAQNTLDTFMDCPGRERAAWLCDSFFSAKGFFALTDSAKVEKDFLENWLLPDSFGDLPEGMLPMTYPSSATSGSFIPNWAMWYVLQLEDYLKRSGDRAFVDAMKPRMEKLIKFFRQYRNADGLLEKLPSWVFIEWSAANEYVQDVNYPANMTWAGVLEAYGRMYGDAETKAEAAKVRKTIFEQSFNGRFFRDHAKRWPDGSLTVMPECTETCQDYALFFRFGDKATPGNWYRTVLDKLGGARPYGSDILPEIGKPAPFIGDALRLLALSEFGETEILKRDLKAFYLAQARRTGTLWETEKEIHSNCHGFAGVAADILLRFVNCAGQTAARETQPLNRDARFDNAVLRATTDHADALYRCGEKMVFTLNAEGVKSPAEGAYYLDWKQWRDDGTERSGVEAFDPASPKVFETSIDRPGFVRYSFTLLGADKRPIYKSKDGTWGPIAIICECGAGAEPEKLDFPPEPKDFDAFWRKQLAELRKVPRNAKVEKIEIENESVDCYRLSIPCAGGRPATGYMTVPKCPKDAKWPLDISFHGYGTFTQTAPKSGPKDKIDISINAHGYDLDREPEYYKEFWKGVKLNERGQYGMDPADNARPETSYFRGMVLRAVRAIEWAKTLKNWDGKNLRVWGGSQGGMQSLWVAALVDGITELEPIVPWGADIIGKTKGHYFFAPLCLVYAPGLDYYDTVNFAKRIPATCRVNISRSGLGDIHCPPSGQWLLYRAIKAPKSITFLQNSNHGGASGGMEKNQHKTYSAGVAKDAPKNTESSATAVLGDAWNK